jgi:hypothetical protein
MRRAAKKTLDLGSTAEEPMLCPFRGRHIVRQTGPDFRVRLGLVLILCFFSSCSDGAPGRAAYQESGCPRCHGSDLRGTKLGPTLGNLKDRWNRPRLEEFLASPDRFRADDQRLARLAEKYSSPMPTFLMSDTLRTNLAAYLLKDPN